jgi:hypothetical protein
VQQGIGVYYTSLRWGGISFAILEDRKWKSAPKVMLPTAGIVNGWAQNSGYNAARDGDVPGAELLGPRQLAFLDSWAQDWRGKVWMKVALSQTLFANIATLPPPANTDAVVPRLPIPPAGEYIRGDVQAADHDSNGWPQAGRNAGVRALRRAAAVHLCGDQHLGSTLQYGVEDWDDASFALCSPALSNLFPRRWYPADPGKQGRLLAQAVPGSISRRVRQQGHNPRRLQSGANGPRAESAWTVRRIRHRGLRSQHARDYVDDVRKTRRQAGQGLADQNSPARQRLVRREIHAATRPGRGSARFLCASPSRSRNPVHDSHSG